MIINVYSSAPITDMECDMIKDIFKEAVCPNEAMLNSIPNFKSFDGKDTIFLGDEDNYLVSFEVDKKE